MADIMYLSFLENRFANMYSNPAIEQVQRIQQIYLDLQNRCNDIAIQQTQYTQNIIDKFNIRPMIDQIQHIQASYSNLATTLINAANTYQSSFQYVQSSFQSTLSDFRHWIDITTNIIQPLDNISATDDLEFSITDEYISSTKSILNDLQNSIPNETEQDQQAHSLINNTKNILLTLKNSKIAKFILCNLIIPFILQLFAAYTINYLPSFNTDRIEKAIYTVGKTIHSDFAELISAINTYMEQQANIDSEQNERLDRLEKLAEQSESNNN